MKIKILLIAFGIQACTFNTNKTSDMKFDFETKYEKSNGTESVTYEEGIEYCNRLAATFPTIHIQEMGLTDCGLPLHLILYSKDEDFNIESIRKKGNAIVYINNAIHPGETDGVDASLMLLRNLAEEKLLVDEMENIVLAVVPFYNIGGALNRSSTSRVNQNGPKEYGFRGNSRNYDLNRDFIKNDTKNAKSFAQLFHYLDPDIFLDTHVSNGADYQYVITLISTQKDKFGGPLSKFQEETLLPYLYNEMAKTDYEMTPYVNTWGTHLKSTTPDEGIEQFPDYPRYSTGYTTLFNTIGFMTETHMLKPYNQRVESTYLFMETLLKATHLYKNKILKSRASAKEEIRRKKQFDIAWELDTSKHRMIPFKGYEHEYRPSKVTGKDRLFYDRNKPYDKLIPYYDNYKASRSVEKPEYYIIPQSWYNIIELLTLNGVQMEELDKDETLEVEYYKIKDYKTVNSPFEGHYVHYDIDLEKQKGSVYFRKGDFKIPVNQEQNRYIIETLEPHAVDSYFKWNFFDMILQRKEHYSSYVFEDLAEKILNENPDLKSRFENRKADDKAFAENASEQLNFIYRHSEYSEKEYMRYPVYRLN